MSRGQDVLGVLRGLQTVVEAGLKVQESQLNRLWVSSSLKTVRDDVSHRLKGKLSDFGPTNVKDMERALADGVGRVSTVFEGVAGFAKIITKEDGREHAKPTPSDGRKEYHSEASAASTATANQTAPPEPPPKIEFKIKLTPSDKALLKKLDMEHREKLKRKEKATEEVHTGKDVESVDEMGVIETKKEDSTVKSIPMPTVKPKAKQTLSSSAKQRTVPSSRIGRMFSFGSLAAGLGIGTAAEYARRTLGISDASKTTLDSLFLSPANTERIVDTLCKVRGAALKIGQLLSIQDESIVSPALAKALERVRKSADFMPDWQVEKVLIAEFGPDWRRKFGEFDMRPFAAASIGQVHWAKTLDGQEVALKLQYPGVAKSIESDIDNLVGIMKVWNMFPDGMFLDNVVIVAKKELAWEVDYDREAECTRKFRKLLEPHQEYYVPKVYDDLCTRQVFTSELIEGLPVDQCTNMSYETKKDIALKVLRLTLIELMELRYMQTDPNWANFFYNANSGKMILLDFGATREYSKEFMDIYVRIIKAASDGDRDTVLALSRDIGFLTGYESRLMEEAHVDAVMILGEAFQKDGDFDFATQHTTQKIQNLVPTMLAHRLCPPPEEVYSIHRKVSGVFLLCSKFKVAINCRKPFLEMYEKYKFDS